MPYIYFYISNGVGKKKKTNSRYLSTFEHTFLL